MNIFLIGFMGAGKSTVGEKLSQKLEYLFLDTDVLVEQREQKSIADIVANNGEQAFREIEHRLLKELSGSIENTVVACGGGMPCYFDNIGVMKKNGIVIYLQVSKELLVRRLNKNSERRFLLKDKNNYEIAQFITAKILEREVFYHQADYIIDNNGVAEQSVAEIVNLNLK